MNNQTIFLEKITKLLELAGIEYMVAGSFSSSFHGYPRATNDLDIIIDTNVDKLEKFIDSLGDGYYVSSQAAIAALNNNGMFNILDNETGWKADLIFRKRRPYSVTEFNRKMPVQFEDIRLNIVSPEDSIISKLEWSKQTGSQIQINDILGILEVKANEIDLEYIKEWAERLGLISELNLLLGKYKEKS